jgi:outer membrane protein OmpA-like peptidoglycan-associated protein
LVYFSQRFFLSTMTFRTFACLGLFAVCLAAQNAAPPAARRSPKDLESKDIKLGEDEPGCKDSALLQRIPGCSIIQCDVKDSDTLEIQVGMSTDGAVQKESMDGASEIIYYLCPSKVTLPHIAKFSDTTLGKAGYKIVFNGKDDDDQPLVTALREMQWLQISTYMYNDYTAYVLSAVKVAPESQATSEALAEDMVKNGRVALQGFNFAKEKFDMPSDAEKVLAEVAALLVRQPSWKICVEAHSGDAGDRQANVALSQKRASAVATWLLDHGIDKSRVSIQGVGDTDPSQRIELVRF